jgi:hypothetical protein
MKISLFLLSLITFLNFLHSELLGVVQINRHGARTGKNYDDITSSLFYGSSDTQLTINGYKQQEALGHWIAERYMYIDHQLLSRDYNHEEILFKVSPEERTIFSAAGFVKGLYPFSKITPIFKKNKGETIKMKQNDIPPIYDYKLKLNRPEIHLFVENPDTDNIFHSSRCKLSSNSTEKLSDMLINTVLFNLTKQEIKNAIDDIKSQWPHPFHNKSEEQIYTKKFLKFLNAFIRPTQYHFDSKYFNLSQFTNSVLNKIQVEKWYGKRLIESEALKLMTSGLYDDVMKYLDLFSNRSRDKSQKLKYVLYSGHDATIIGVFTTIFEKDFLSKKIEEIDQHYNFLQPDFASHLIFEVHSVKTPKGGFLGGHNNTQDYKFIRVIYNGIIIRDGFKKNIKYDHKCDGIPLENFNNYLKESIDLQFKNLYCKKEGGDDDSLSLSISSFLR